MHLPDDPDAHLSEEERAALVGRHPLLDTCAPRLNTLPNASPSPIVHMQFGWRLQQQPEYVADRAPAL
jgi:hypothetical protein